MNRTCLALLLAAGALLRPASALADPPPAAPAPATSQSAPAYLDGWHPSVEADWLPYALRGYSVLLGLKAPVARGWSFKLGALAYRLPQAMLELNPDNLGFGGRLRLAVGGGAQRFFGGGRGGFFVGPLAMLQFLEYTHRDAPGQVALATNLVVGAQGGYQWFPFDALGLYLLPWIGPFLNLHLSGEAKLAGHTLKELPLQPAFGIHLGYEL